MSLIKNKHKRRFQGLKLLILDCRPLVWAFIQFFVITPIVLFFIWFIFSIVILSDPGNPYNSMP